MKFAPPPRMVLAERFRLGPLALLALELGLGLGLVFGLGATLPLHAADAGPRVVINEVFYDPPDRTVPLEFIELYNAGTAEADLSGWRFTDGISFVFPAGQRLAPGTFAVVAENPSAFATRFGLRPLGPWTGSLDNDGERLRLVDATGNVVDEVTYGAGFPWPTAARGAGPSMELLHPALDRREPGAWRSSQPKSQTPPTTFIPIHSPAWRYRPGTNEVSTPANAWRERDFAEAESWHTGQTSIGYGDEDDNTPLPEMRNQYTTVYLRHAFTIAADAIPAALVLRVRVDDGCVAWLNGHEIGRLHAPSGDLGFDATGLDHEAGASFEDLLLPDAAAWLVPGKNVLAIHALNVSAGSSDLTFDAELRTPGDGGEFAEPTPGARNSVYSTQPLPLLEEVRHEPRQPRSGDPVVITVRLTNVTEVASVKVRYQPISPGNYVRRSDPAFATAWVEIDALDDGLANDARAGDGVFSATVAGSLQVHRQLIRYQVVVRGTSGATFSAPYEDDESPNFAWFTHDGIPAWRGANRPGVAGENGVVRTFETNLFTTLPAYHLLAVENDVVRSQYDGGFDGVRMWGTVVFDGEVYDHIQFHNRGEASTYVSGKNKWRLHFNRAREFAARDAWGRPYRERWDVLNLNPCSSPWAAVNRGMAGLDEAIAFRVYQLLGLPSSHTHHVQFRILDRAEEAPANSQYNGDAWGLYLAIEHPDGAFLDQHQLPDGNLYKLEGGPDLKHQGATQPANGADWSAFANGSGANASASWWRTNLNLPAYFAFHAGNRVVGNIDLREGWNHYFFHHPDGRWVPIPWDLDMQFIAKTHWSGTIDQRLCLSVPAIRAEFRQRAREVLDLLLGDAGDAGGQIGQLIDEYADIVRPPGLPLTWVEFDEYLWNYNPRTPGDGNPNGQTNHRGNFFRTPFTDSRIGGTWVRTLISPDFAGSVQYLKDYCTDTFTGATWRPNNGDQHGYAYGYLASEAADVEIPNTPTITYAGANGFPLQDLRFSAGVFEDPQGSDTFGGIAWRVAEIAAPGLDGFTPGTPRKYEIETLSESTNLPRAAREFRLPPTRLQPGHTYRVRARYFDATGRASHWSAPVQFVAGAPDIGSWRSQLRISEVMYHPAEPSAAELAKGWTANDFEFVELLNLGARALDLTGLRFSAGLEAELPGETTLTAGATGVLVSNAGAFAFRYGTSPRILGTFSDSNLDNGGEHIALSFGLGTIVHEFTYDDHAPWPAAADRGGYSLERVRLEVADHASADVWTASATLGGSPGRLAGLTYTAWAGGEPRLSDPDADADGDGKPNWVEFAQGTPPLLADAPVALTPTACPESPSDLCLERQRRPGAEGVRALLESSADLRAWQPFEATTVRTRPATAPAVGQIETFRIPLSGDHDHAGAGFFRLRVERVASGNP